jgi:hypothetical protein
MSDGSQKAIDKLRVGDLVEARDPASGQVKAERVDATFDHENPEGWVALQVGGETIAVTTEHPFWVASKHRFVPAGQLEAGDELVLPDGSLVPVAAAKPFSSLADHYNLTIHDLHTYFVGSLPVLVHNTSLCPKAVNLPAWRRVEIDMEEVTSGHMEGGYRLIQSRIDATGGGKDAFPAGMSEGEVASAIRQAYRFGRAVERQGERSRVIGPWGNYQIEMWVNRSTRIIETAYPKF